MTYVFALASLGGDSDSNSYLVHGIKSMKVYFLDKKYGGWYSVVSPTSQIDSSKKAYELAFAILSTSAAVTVGSQGAEELLNSSVETLNKHFWEESTGLVVDVWNEYFTQSEEYRGINANMHMVEAFIALYDLTKDEIWRERSLRIAEFVLRGAVEKYENLIPEHYLPSLVLDKNYNLQIPAHPFRPYGIVIGHLFEWSRLAINLHRSLGAASPSWLMQDAAKIYSNAKRIGWFVDGSKGFIYTSDFVGKPVVTDRMHWVVAEAIGAAWSFYEETGEVSYKNDYLEWWQYAIDFVVDQEHGFWLHELNQRNQRTEKVWKGNPDIYHAYQATILSTLERPISFAQALVRKYSSNLQ
jgi:mannose/cellobiose epimerase-like protein (N-acyl-D-glucosamine 2-epimerase family)